MKRLLRFGFVAGLVLGAALLPVQARQDHAGHDAAPAKQEPAQQPAGGMDHSQHGAAPAADPAKPDPRPPFFRGKSYSEFSHRMAGVFVFLAGVFYLMKEAIARRWPGARYAWPVCLLVPGLYLLVFSDPRWVFGTQSFWELFQSSAEFQQHKIYSAILIILGGFELARVRGTIRGAWAALVFPALAMAGAVLLLFHPHGGAEHSPEHMAVMGKIQNQHFSFFMVGLGIALGKGLSEIPWKAEWIFLRVWPVLMLVLGVMLMFYSE